MKLSLNHISVTMYSTIHRGIPQPSKQKCLSIIVATLIVILFLIFPDTVEDPLGFSDA